MKSVNPYRLPFLHFRESCSIWDERDQKWKPAYFRAFKRQETVLLINDITFNSAGQIKISEPFECAAFARLLLLINLVATGSPTSLRCRLEFSDNKINWYRYMGGTFDYLPWQSGGTSTKECLDALVLATWMRLYLLSSGCDDDNKYQVIVKGVFNG